MRAGGEIHRPFCFAMALLPLLLSRIRSRGPLTVAEFMELALYHPAHGYYSTAAQRSGRAGDFFTSVDVSPLFGASIAIQLAEMWRVLRDRGDETFELVEVGAGNGRLARDVMDAAARESPDFYRAIRLTLVERSAAARRHQAATLGPHLDKATAFRRTLPNRVTGVVYANELLDAFPVHVVTRTAGGVRELMVEECDGELVESVGPAPGAAVASHLEAGRIGIRRGERFEVGLAASRWMADVSRTLQRGFLMVFDYGREARELTSGSHPAGTLTASRRHALAPVSWLASPGECDLTSHLDLTAIRRAAERAGMVTLGILDQVYFLLALGLAGRIETGDDRRAMSQRIAARTLIMPGGLGSTMKAMIFAKAIGTPSLRGTVSGRLT
jgi:SAM-dependent MidA family methyltransferase